MSAGLSWGYQVRGHTLINNVPHQRFEDEWEVVLHVVPDVVLDRLLVLLGLLQAVVTRVVGGLLAQLDPRHSYNPGLRLHPIFFPDILVFPQ